MCNFAVTLTTIRTADLLEDYAKNFLQYGHKNVLFIIVGDVKTPHRLNEKIAKRLRNLGFEAYYFDIKSQKKWLQDFPELERIVPYNSDNRRNLGYLYAAEMGAKKIVVIDDDNYIGKGDYLGSHSIVGTALKLCSVHSENGWFNPCSLLRFNYDYPIYMRGFPFHKRGTNNTIFEIDSGRVVINVGLWTETPDVDALAHLVFPNLKSVSLKSRRVMLGSNIYAPINTQNTAFLTEVLPCFYFIPMGIISGIEMDWFGDVWAGLFARKVIDHLGNKVTFGEPVCVHKRESRNELFQLKKQLFGMILHEELTDVVPQICLTERSYSGAYLELANKLSKIEYKTKFARAYLNKVANGMRVWVNACEKIGI